ncbi:MAG: hypothetical protein E6G76_00095 [Alphaproteobacteria bacterium]|jgi:hypothetical protein|nr:MAG: hypothetical protein E6G76_00095 [Alphaproteobacteria bacterium]
MSAEQKKRPDDYRRLAEQCRRAAGMAPTEKERNNLLARAKTFDFLAEHSRAAAVLECNE